MTEPAGDVAESDLFEGDPVAREIHGQIRGALDGLADLSATVSDSQVAYRHGRTFAVVWQPDHSGPDVPLVLSLVLREPLDSSRPREVVRVARDACVHHLDLRSAHDVDEEVRAWLRSAWAAADRRVPRGAVAATDREEGEGGVDGDVE